MSRTDKAFAIMALILFIIAIFFGDAIGEAAAHNGWIAALIFIAFILELIFVAVMIIKGVSK